MPTSDRNLRRNTIQPHRSTKQRSGRRARHFPVAHRDAPRRTCDRERRLPGNGLGVRDKSLPRAEDMIVRVALGFFFELLEDPVVLPVLLFGGVQGVYRAVRLALVARFPSFNEVGPYLWKRKFHKSPSGGNVPCRVLQSRGGTILASLIPQPASGSVLLARQPAKSSDSVARDVERRRDLRRDTRRV